MKDSVQFYLEDNNIIINWDKFCDFVTMCIKDNIGQDINERTCLYNDCEVAYDALRSFFDNSFKQLKLGFKVIFIRGKGRIIKQFNNYNEFDLWINNSFCGKNVDFVKESIIYKLLQIKSE